MASRRTKVVYKGLGMGMIFTAQLEVPTIFEFPTGEAPLQLREAINDGENQFYVVLERKGYTLKPDHATWTLVSGLDVGE